MNYLERPLRDYLEDAASGRPTPGGGSVSALVGALGVTMAEMAANFTLGREKFREVAPAVEELLGLLGDARGKLLDLVEKDIAAYGEVSSAYALPRGSEVEKAARTAAIQEALRVALRAPLEAMQVVTAALEATRQLAEVANPNLLSDVGVAAELLLGALRGARLNVDVNLAYLKDEEVVRSARREADGLQDQARRLHQETVQVVGGRLSRR